jgi:Ser/Thr protein kinase RdoA (MazF antagonist)
MFIYPQLTPSEQASLPKLLARPETIPNKFEDSTHQLFHCQTADGGMVLKVCNQATIQRSSFWSGANHLFAADFPNSLGEIHLTHDFLQKNGALSVPECVSASAHRFILSRFLAGKDVETQHISDQWVIRLAGHIAKLHQCTYASWGKLHTPEFSAQEWASRLHDTLLFLARQHATPIAEPLLAEVLTGAAKCHETEFVPMMLDLRWDQFRSTNSNSNSGSSELALIDLDAFVIAPRALDLVLLEYILTPAQLALFKQHYVQTHAWPDHNENTPSYQLLLFLLNILGVSDVKAWMQRI